LLTVIVAISAMKKTVVLFLSCLVLTALSAHAQITPGRVLRPIRPDPNAPAPRSATPAPATGATNAAAGPVKLISPLVTVLDTNKNTVIDAVEITAAPTLLLKLDGNKDGKLTVDEDLGKGESTNSPLIRVLDANHDGVIDEKEIAGSPSVLRMLDKNYDGRLTLGEYKPVAAPATKTETETKSSN
jgi:hypothetical protein